jgi:hypothetical protein
MAISETGLKQLKRIRVLHLGYNAMKADQRQPMFRSDIPPPSSVSKSKPNMKPVWSRQQIQQRKYLWANFLPRIPPSPFWRTTTSTLEICCPPFRKKKSWWRQSIPSALSFPFLGNEITRVSSDKQIRKQTNSHRIHNSSVVFLIVLPATNDVKGTVLNCAKIYHASFNLSTNSLLNKQLKPRVYRWNQFFYLLLSPDTGFGGGGGTR